MGRLEYCAEAEPKLLALRDVTDKAEAYERLGQLVGKRRFDADWTAAQKPKPKDREQAMWAIECWEKEHPLSDPATYLHARLFGGPCRRPVAEKEDVCMCVLCDTARDLGLLEALALQEKR